MATMVGSAVSNPIVNQVRGRRISLRSSTRITARRRRSSGTAGDPGPAGDPVAAVGGDRQHDVLQAAPLRSQGGDPDAGRDQLGVAPPRVAAGVRVADLRAERRSLEDVVLAVTT